MHYREILIESKLVTFKYHETFANGKYERVQVKP